MCQLVGAWAEVLFQQALTKNVPMHGYPSRTELRSQLDDVSVSLSILWSLRAAVRRSKAAGIGRAPIVLPRASPILGAGQQQIAAVPKGTVGTIARFLSPAPGFAAPLICSLVYSGAALVYAVAFLQVIGGC